jgi:hypothetical protein
MAAEARVDAMIRAVEECPHRQPTGAPGEGLCRLLGAITGVTRPAALRVGDDACRACCAAPVPEPRRINPVLASLVSRLAEEVERAGGEPGCDARRAAELRDWARRHLALAGPDLQRVYQPPRATRDCHHLGERLGPGPAEDGAPSTEGAAWSCRHPSHETTTRDGCLLCRDWADRPRPAPRPLAELLPPPPRRGPAVRSWAVGVRSAPRNVPTLDWTLDSLARAGWESPRIFEDLPTPIAARHARCPVSRREPAVGAFLNFYLGLAELVLRHPEADAYLMVEDDVIFYDRQDLREHLEGVLWPSDPPGLISLYCSSVYSRPDPGWYQKEGRWRWGSQVFIFPRELARAFVADPLILSHRWSHPIHGLYGVDVLIGAWAELNGIPVHYPCPSLAQHIGDTSTLWESLRLQGDRLADRFLLDVEPD